MAVTKKIVNHKIPIVTSIVPSDITILPWAFHNEKGIANMNKYEIS